MDKLEAVKVLAAHQWSALVVRPWRRRQARRQMIQSRELRRAARWLRTECPSDDERWSHAQWERGLRAVGVDEARAAENRRYHEKIDQAITDIQAGRDPA